MHPLLNMLSILDPRDGVPLVQEAVTSLGGRLRGDFAADGETTLADRDPAVLGAFLDGVRWLARRYFRARTVDVANVPATGPALLVGNHNGGLLAFDWALTVLAVWEAHGPRRAVYGLGHDLLQWNRILRKYGGRVGALRAGHASAETVFAEGHLALVYPGSDYDAFRPFAERDRVVLGGRTGFLKLALRTGVPIVPVVTAGAQEQFVVLTRGEGLARALAMPRWLRSKVCPIGLSLPWGLTSSFLPYLPLPTQITTAFCPPMRFDDPPAAADDPHVLARCYAAIEAVMQAKLDELTAGRVPFLGS
ncbi:MAG TPA: 1-acyl-sn-glycerol-3-phosphate acyltransferase [Polyangia bacterium]|jgi:1-acyl-sn-glycerol-3-phosphate acyltransferase